MICRPFSGYPGGEIIMDVIRVLPPENMAMENHAEVRAGVGTQCGSEANLVLDMPPEYLSADR